MNPVLEQFRALTKSSKLKTIKVKAPIEIMVQNEVCFKRNTPHFVELEEGKPSGSCSEANLEIGIFCG